MLKIGTTFAVATLLLGFSVDTEPKSGSLKFMASSPAQAHVSQWDHSHQCNPSPCKRLRDRHKKGTGSVTE
jgi:hypothetical protein